MALKNLTDDEKNYMKESTNPNQHPILISEYQFMQQKKHGLHVTPMEADIMIIRAILKGNESPEFTELKSVFNNIKKHIPRDATPGEKAMFTPQIPQEYITSLMFNYSESTYFNFETSKILDMNGFGEEQKSILKQGLRDLYPQLVAAKKSLSGAAWLNHGEKNFKEHYASPADSKATLDKRKNLLETRIDSLITAVKNAQGKSIDTIFKPLISLPNKIDPRYGQTNEGLPIAITDKFWYKTDKNTVVGRLAHEFSHYITSGHTEDIEGIKYGVASTARALDNNRSEDVFENADSFRFYLMKTPLPRSKSLSKSHISYQDETEQNLADCNESFCLDNPHLIVSAHDTSHQNQETSNTKNNEDNEDLNRYTL